MIFSLWGIVLAALAVKRRGIDNMDDVKATLVENWDNVSMDDI